MTQRVLYFLELLKSQISEYMLKIPKHIELIYKYRAEVIILIVCTLPS